MVQKIEEQDGYILLYFGTPPADVEQIEFVVILAHQQKQILFCKWCDDGTWMLPSGRVELGETAEAAAHRELLEETGATLQNIEILCYMHCFMFDLEYWGIAYLGEIEQLGHPSDLNEVSEAALFSCLPENPSKSAPLQNQIKALYIAAISQLSGSS